MTYARSRLQSAGWTNAGTVVMFLFCTMMGSAVLAEEESEYLSSVRKELSAWGDPVIEWGKKPDSDLGRARLWSFGAAEKPIDVDGQPFTKAKRITIDEVGCGEAWRTQLKAVVPSPPPESRRKRTQSDEEWERQREADERLRNATLWRNKKWWGYLRYYARVTGPEKEAEIVLLEHDGGRRLVKLGPTWQRFEAAFEIKPGFFEVSWQLGQDKRQIEIGGIMLARFEKPSAEGAKALSELRLNEHEKLPARFGQRQVNYRAPEPKAAAVPQVRRNAIVFSCEGSNRDQIDYLLMSGKMPNVAAMIQEGAYVPIEFPQGEGSESRTAGAVVITGYETRMLEPDRGSLLSAPRPITQGWTMFERLEKHSGRDEFVTAGLFAKPYWQNYGPEEGLDSETAGTFDGWFQPTYEKTEHGKTTWYRRGMPLYHASQVMDVYQWGTLKGHVPGFRKTGDRDSGDLTEEVIRQLDTFRGKPFFFYVLFGRIDDYGHRPGCRTAADNHDQNVEIAETDGHIGKVVAKLKRLGVYEDTWIYITAPHGGDIGGKSDGGNHNFAPRVCLISNDPSIAQGGLRRDIAPTIYEGFGLDVTKMEPPLSGRSLRTTAAGK